MLFSIIIPVFNGEKTITRCLESVRAQSFSDFEVILIDDGSTDSSLSICRSAAQNDKRFQVYTQKNSGPSRARNRGLQAAQGSYICFLDSDDYLSPRYLEKLSEKGKTTQADMIFFGYHLVDGEGRIKKTCLPPVGLNGALLIAALSERDLFGYTWIKCFSRKAVQGALFPEDMTLFEDEVFTCMAALNSLNVETLDEPLYYYSSPGEDALSKRYYPEYCSLSDRVFQAWERVAQRYGVLEPFIRRKADYFTKRCIFYGFEHDVDFKGYFGNLAETSFFKEHSNCSALDRQIQRGNWRTVKAAAMIYRMKNKPALRIR